MDENEGLVESEWNPEINKKVYPWTLEGVMENCLFTQSSFSISMFSRRRRPVVVEEVVGLVEEELLEVVVELDVVELLGVVLVVEDEEHAVVDLVQVIV